MLKDNEMSRDEFVLALKDVLHISLSYKETYTECIALILFLRKKGLTEEYQADKQLREEVMSIVEESYQLYDKEMAEREKKRKEDSVEDG